jgi:hypothetical protein
VARTIAYTDDLDGSTNAQTLTFAFDGKAYEIDLSKRNRAALEKVLAPYISAARRAGGGRTSSGSGRTVRTRSERVKRSAEDLAAVRTWARENGWPDLSNRGRIPRDAEEAYRAAAG